MIITVPFFAVVWRAPAPLDGGCLDGEAKASGVGCPVQRIHHVPALPVQVSVTPGALDCWVFLSCLEVLQRIEGCCDRAQIDSNIAHTVGLWSYATAKVVCVHGAIHGLSRRGRQRELLADVCALDSLDSSGYFRAWLKAAVD